MLAEIKKQMMSYFVGKEDVVEAVLICLLARGHVLIEDVPGVGKTTLAKTLAGVMEASMGRIQFTPDTLPSDVLGVSIYNQKTGEFEYKKGPILNQIVLADECNRTSPKTQAALLEAMSEGQITVDDKTYVMEDPFMVIATQNPSEFLGTYPLPEAQKDRFMMSLTIGYPGKEAEVILAQHFLEGKIQEPVQSVCTASDILKLRKKVDAVHVNNAMLEYMQNIVDLTRKSKDFVLGASPRAYLSLIKASQAKAFLEGRDFVKPDDVRAIGVSVLHHRLELTPEAKIRKEDLDTLVTSLLLQAKIPMEIDDEKK